MATITFVTSGGRTVQVPDESNLLRISLREKGGIPFKCGGGKCGTCRCHIDSGLENMDAVKPKERDHLTEAEIAGGWRMACQAFVQQGDVSVSWITLAERVPTPTDRKPPTVTSKPSGAA